MILWPLFTKKKSTQTICSGRRDIDLCPQFTGIWKIRIFRNKLYWNCLFLNVSTCMLLVMLPWFEGGKYTNKGWIQLFQEFFFMVAFYYQYSSSNNSHFQKVFFGENLVLSIKKNWKDFDWLIFDFWCLMPLSTILHYIMVTSFSGGRSRSTRREPPTMGKQLVNFITCDCESSAPFFVIYKAGHEPTPYWW